MTNERESRGGRRAVLLVGALVALFGCKGGDATAPAAAVPNLVLPTIPTPGGASAAPAAGTATTATATARLSDQTPVSTAIHVEFLDREFYHAASRNRVIRDVRNTDVLKRFTGADYRVGLLMSARNDSDHLLAMPRVLSDVVIRGAHASAKCRPEVNRYSAPVVVYASPTPDLRTAWGDDSRSVNESPWRPGETIRVQVILGCASVHLPDIGIQALAGSVRLAASTYHVPRVAPCPYPNEYVCDDDVVGTSPALELPGRAMVLQQVQLPSGLAGFAAGDLLVRVADGRALHENLATYGVSAFTVNGSDLPSQAQFGRETVGEWSTAVSGVTMRSWLDAPGTPKGQRIVSVTANLAIDRAAIEARVAAVATDPEAALGDVASERSRLAGLLACDAVELVTQVRQVRSTNGRDVKTQCTALATEDTVQVTWTFATDRYELPLGLSYSVDRVAHTSFFANATLATFDPR